MRGRGAVLRAWSRPPAPSLPADFIEQRRAGNFLGNLLWQLNDVWPAVSWGTLEYGTASSSTRGQITGGRWKPAHYALRGGLFADSLVACGGDGRCYVRHDGATRGLNATVTLEVVHAVTGSATTVASAVPVALPSGAAGTAWDGLCFTGPAAGGACAPLGPWLSSQRCAADGSDCIVTGQISDAATGAVIASNWLALTTPGALAAALPRAAVTAAAAAAPNADGSINVTVTTTASALYVTLTASVPGRFSDNAFCIWGGPRALAVTFVPWGPPDVAGLASTLRVEHVRAYL